METQTTVSVTAPPESPPFRPPSFDKPVTFSDTLNPTIPLSFLNSTFAFLAKHAPHFFLADTSHSDVVSLFDSFKNEILASFDSSSSPQYRAPNKDNGLDFERYTWGQTLEHVTVTVTFPPGTKTSILANNIMSTHLKIGLKDQPPIIDGSLYLPVKPAECYWSLEDRQLLTVHLVKYEPLQWWPCLVKGEPELDTRMIKSEISKLDDFDTETRMTLQTILFDERQKALGRLTLGERRKREFLKTFMDEHPEMDFLTASLANRMKIW